MNIRWRPYQIACKQAIKEKYDNGINKQLIVQATGTGKRMQAVDLAKHFKRTMFLAHREELIMQAYHEIEQYWPMNVGIIKGPVFEVEKKIVVASVQTIYNRLDKIDPREFELLIIDEAHHYVSPSYLKSVRHFEPKLTTGWTATPKRLDGLSLTNIAQEITFQYLIEDGIRDGWLAPLTAYQIRTPADISRVKRTGGDFNLKQLSEKVDSELRNTLIAAKYKEYADNRQTIAYCVDIDHAYNLGRVLRDNGINADTVVSDTTRCPNRTQIVESFRKGEISVLTNVNILTEGFDHDDVGCIIMARPTQSETLYIQSIGRGTRLKSDMFQERVGSSDCIVLDFVDNSGNLSLVNAWELERDKPIEERLFIPEKHRQKLLEEREKRERRMRIRYGSDKKINLLKLPEVRPWNSEKMLEPATEKQLKWIIDMGVYQEGIEYTKAMASELISAQPAREWQIRWLAERKYDVSGKVTLGQFQKVKWLIENREKYAMDDKTKNNLLSDDN